MLNIYELPIFLIAILLSSIAIDTLLGELPAKIHPVVLIGKTIEYFTCCYISQYNRLSGLNLLLTVTSISTVLFIFILLLATINIYLFILISTLLLSTTFSVKLLLSSSDEIKNELKKDLEKARNLMGYLVSRKTNDLNEKLIISATIETLTENITDSCVSPFFYYLLFGLSIFIIITLNNILLIINFDLGSISINLLFYILVITSIAGAVIYRTTNTLDAMVGYKNEKYKMIGWFPAKLDDLLNYIPSRFSGAIVVLSAFILNMNWKNSYFILRRDSRNCPSPNSGFTMAAAAGALDIQLNKKNVYVIGDKNKDLEIEDISKAIILSKIAIILSIIILVNVFLIIYIMITLI